MLPEEIFTQRLKLRPFRFSDVPAVFAYLQDAEMGRFLEGPASTPSEYEAAKIVAQHILADRELRGAWAVTI